MEYAEVVQCNEMRSLLLDAINAIQDLIDLYLARGMYQEACVQYVELVAFYRQFLYIQHKLLGEYDQVTLKNRRVTAAFDMGWISREEWVN